MKLSKKEARVRRHNRLRQKLAGVPERPRMAVFMSDKNIYVQFIDDSVGRTVAAASTCEKAFKETGAKPNVKGAVILGKLVSEKAKSAGIQAVVFDRGGFKYHGKVKALADAARQNGLKL